MRWTEPRYEAMKMDAEIGSYQEDTDPTRETPFAEITARRGARSASPAGSEVRTFRRTVARLARRGALLCAAPAGVAMAIGAAGCSSAAPSGPNGGVGVSTLRASGNGHGNGNNTTPDDDDIVTAAGGRARLGWNNHEPHLTPDKVAGGLALSWESPVLDSFTAPSGQTFPATAWASPLLVKHAPMPGFTDGLDVVVTATGNGFIYAIASASDDPTAPPPGTILWKTKLTTPAVVVGTGSAVKPLFPIGVLGTPIIDLKASPPRIYAASADATAGWQVFAVSLLDGSLIPGWPVEINQSVVEGVNQNAPSLFSFDIKGRAVQRSALALSQDRSLLYVPFGGLRDLAAGWMVVVDTNSPAVTSSFSGSDMTKETANGGMWAVNGPSVDDDGTLFMTLGNAPVGLGAAPHVYGESLLSWAPTNTLTLTGRYTPFNYCDMDAQDADLSGASPMLVTLDPSTTSTPRLAVMGSKGGNIFLVDRSHLSTDLGGRQACTEDSTKDESLLAPDPQPQFGARGPLSVFGPYQAGAFKVISRMHTSPAFFSDSDNNFVFVTGNTKKANAAGTLLDSPPDIVRLKINTAPGQPAYLTIDAAEQTLALLNPSSPVVTSNGSKDPMLWVIDAESSLAEMNFDGVNIAHPILYAVDATTMTVLWHTGVDELGQGAKFISPVVDNGSVFMATDRVRVYGLPAGN